MQPLTGFQIELVDHPGDGLGRTRTQRLLHGPKGFSAVRRLDQDQAGRIETEGAQAMTMETAVLAQPIGRHDEEERMSPRGKQRHDEAEGSSDGALRLGHDLMQGAASEAVLRQVGIKGGKAEGGGFAKTLHPGQQAAQFFHYCGAVSRHGDGSGRCHGGGMPRMFFFYSLEHNKNIAKGV